MNFKLLTFIFVVIGVQSITTSIINKQSIGNLVQTSNLDSEVMNANVGSNPWAKIKSFTFNVSDTVIINGVKYQEVTCKNYDNDFCSKGNGKYQAKIVKCKNLDYGKEEAINRFECKLFGARTLNKNVQYKNSYFIQCATPLTEKTAKGRCRIDYAFASTKSYDEADDVENKF